MNLNNSIDFNYYFLYVQKSHIQKV